MTDTNPIWVERRRVMKRVNQIWTDKEKKILKDWLKEKNPDRDEICKKLKRRWHVIHVYLNRIGVNVPPQKKVEYVPETKPEKPDDKEAKRLIDSQEKEIARLHIQVKDLTERKKIFVHNFYDKVVKIGVLGDSHIGSLYERIDVLEAAYDCYEKNGITQVYHTGDFCEGNGRLFRGQEYEIYAHGAGTQIGQAVEKYPKRKDITTYFITGSHDLSWHKETGLDIGETISEKRDDLVYLGKEMADVMIGKNARRIRMRLLHPRFGSAYAISYHPQKLIESMSGGQKPHILLIGHTHKANFLPCYRNVFAVQTG